MMMNVSDWIPYSFVFITGMGIGLFYYGGLWLTLRRLVDSQRPFVLLAGSFVGRLALSLALFYWIAGGHFLRILVAVAGFVVMRLLLTFVIGTKPAARSTKEQQLRRSFLE